MSEWPDGFDMIFGCDLRGWYVDVMDCRPGVTRICLPGYTTRQEAEGAAIDWIQRRVGVPETVPQPVLAEQRDYSFAKQRIEFLLERLADLDAWFPTPTQADFPDEREHLAAADCNIYRCGLIGQLRQSLQAEKELIEEKLWEK